MTFSSILKPRHRLRYINIRSYSSVVSLFDDWGRYGDCKSFAALRSQRSLWIESVHSELCQQLGSFDLLEALKECYAEK